MRTGGRGKHNFINGGAFCKAKYEIRRLRKARASKNSFPQPPSFLPARAFWFCARSAQSFWVLLKKSSNINQKTPPIFTFCEIVRNSLGAKRLGMIFFRYFEGIFEIARQRAVGNAEVPVQKHRENEVFRTNLFSFAFGERLSVFFLIAQKLISKQYEQHKFTNQKDFSLCS